MMTVKVLFFGIAKDLTGLGQECVEIHEGDCLEVLWRRYESRFPRWKEIAATLVAAVNQEVAGPSQALGDGDEVAFLPPVSGGAGEDFCRMAREAIPTQELARQLKSPEDGAVAIFEGIVRNHSRGRRTLFLEYEAYERMAVRKMEEIAREAKEKFSIDRIGMIHRAGRLEIGETSVAIIVTSAHRGAAFDACRFAIERLKKIVPIWKKEYFEDGAVWAEGEKNEIRKQKSEIRS